MRAEVEAVARPGVEVVLHSDGSADTLLSADRPVLLEGASAVDGGLVGASRDVDVVGTAVSGELTLVLSTRGGVVSAVRLNHVVLDERVAGPAVDSKVAVARGVEGAAVVDGAIRKSVGVSCNERQTDLPASTRVPALATNKVAGVLPGHRVATALAHGVGDISATVRPPGVEVAVVVTLGVGSDGTLLDQSRVVGVIALVKEVEWCSDDTGDCREGEEEGLDSNHGEVRRVACC